MTALRNISDGIISCAQTPLIYGGGRLAWSLAPIRDYDYEDLKKLWRTEYMSDAMFNRFAKKDGFDLVDISKFRTELFQFTRTQAFTINNENYNREKPYWEWHEMLSGITFSPDQVIFLLRRQLIDERTAQMMLNWLFNGERAVTNAYLETMFEIPGSSDLIRFAVREAFTPELVKKFGYHKEFPNAILPWMEKQGYGQDTGVLIPEGATTLAGPDTRRTATWSDLYWWAHWDLPSPTMGYHMVHRLYPDSPYGPSPESNLENVFTSEDLSSLLKAADYPAYWRNRLEAISYLPLGRIDIRRMFNMDVLTEAGVYHSYRALGYNDANAQHLLAFTKKLKDKEKLSRGTRIAKNQVIKLFKLGTLNENEAIDNLATLNYTADEIGIMLATANLEERSTKAKEVITWIKRAFLAGTISRDEAVMVFNQAGVAEPRQRQYLDHWEFAKRLRTKRVSASKAIEMFKMRLIDENVLAYRLYNLGYADVEISTLISEAKVSMLNRAQKEQLKQAKEQATLQQKTMREQERTQEKQVKKIESDQAKAINQREKALNKTLKAFTPANLKRWYLADAITLDDVDSLLKAQGWDSKARTAFKEVDLKEEEQEEPVEEEQPNET
jgi:hypothetical protein